MNNEHQSIRTIAVASHPDMQEASDLAAQVAGFLQEDGRDAFHGSIYSESLRSQVEQGDCDLCIALGGDGTMLRAGHLCAPLKIPILGINLGSLGFLMEVDRDTWKTCLRRVLDGDYWLEVRMMLRAEHLSKGQRMGEWDVINECVVGRGEVVRPVRLITEVDGRYLTTYVADALIVATPTGSTAYALAAGGPILPPEVRNILIVPVAPHLSVDRAIVLHEGSSVQVTVRTDHEATLSIDGKSPERLADQDQVQVRACEHVVEFVRLQEPDYFYRNLTSRMNQNPSAEKRP
jgi:NAD+ kinase